MTRKQALIDLRDKVAAGVSGRWTFDALGDDASGYALDAFHGSLDGSQSLHNAVMHEAAWATIFYAKRYADESNVEVTNTTGTWKARAETPARAWLLAILSALIAECDE